jgi:hypothetical protein
MQIKRMRTKKAMNAAAGYFEDMSTIHDSVRTKPVLAFSRITLICVHNVVINGEVEEVGVGGDGEYGSSIPNSSSSRLISSGQNMFVLLLKFISLFPGMRGENDECEKKEKTDFYMKSSDTKFYYTFL